MKAQLLKSADKPAIQKYAVGSYIFNIVHHTLFINGKSKKISYRESELLKILFESKDKVVNRKDILDKLWGDENFFTGRSLDVFICRLRSYMKADPQIKIINIRGIGYMLILKEDE